MFKRRRPDEPAGIDPAFPSNVAENGSDFMIQDDPAPSGDGAEPSPSQGEPARPAESGLGVPPFQPAVPKESPSMARPPFSPTPAPGASGGPLTGATLPGGALPGTRVGQPNGMPGRPQPSNGERRTLVVGRGISVQGTVTDAERLVVEGTVEATMIRATELAVSPGGVFKGEIEVEEAEVAGTIDGTVTARGALVVRTSGRVLGTAHCRRLQVEDGGQITGRIEMITEGQAMKIEA